MSESTALMILFSGMILGLTVWCICFYILKQIKNTPHITTQKSQSSSPSSEHAFKEFLRQSVNTYKITKISEKEYHIEILYSIFMIKYENSSGFFYLNTKVDISTLKKIYLRVFRLFVYGLQPLLIIGIPILLYKFAAINPNPGIRWQVIQVIHIIHVLWPPFLMFFIFKKLTNSIQLIVNNIHTITQIGN